MGISIKNLRAAGVTPDQILKIVAESLAEEAENNRQRQKRWRARQKIAKEIKDHVTLRNAYNVTDPVFPAFAEQNQSTRNVTSVTDPPLCKKEQESKEGRKPESRKKPLTVLPDDWSPKPAHFALARERQGWDEWRTHDQAERFRDKARAKNYRYADWDAAFRNWITSPYQQNGQQNGQRTNPKSIREAFARLDARLSDNGGEDLRPTVVGLLSRRRSI